jgi:pyrophosphatase PpaX
MAFRAVLFDLDGTLVDSVELIVKAAQFAFASRPGPRPDRAQIMAGIGRPLVEQFRDYAEDEEAVAAYVQAYREYQLTHHDTLTAAYPGVNDVVAHLRANGKSLGVVTSKIEPLAHRALQFIGLQDCFAVVVGIESTARHKPNPEPLLYALERLAATPDEAVYVGDSPFDVQAARHAGMTSIAVTWGAFTEATLRTHEPHFVVRSPSELLTYVM